MKRNYKLLALILALCLCLPIFAACGNGDKQTTEPVYSEGLEFTLNDDGNTYSVTGIGTCTDTDIKLPPVYNKLSVTNIGAGAFYDCDSLESITIPDSITNISISAFEGCSKLIQIENEVYYVDKWAIDCDESVTNVILRSDTVGIATNAFNYCDSLESITIPNSVIYIGDAAFYGCSSLESITIPDGVTSIGDAAFYGCSSLTSVTIPDSVTSIGMSAFSGCSKLEQEENGVSYVDKWAIDCHMSATNVILRFDTVGIGAYAFASCNSLENIVIPDSVISIGAYAFASCNSLQNIVIPDSVISIDTNTFSGCNNLTSINVDEKNNYYCSIDGNLYNKDATTLIRYAIGKTDTSFIVPEVTTSIGAYAFAACNSLENIVIPDSVISIGTNTFSGCNNLTNINVDEKNNYYCSIDGNLYNKDATTLIRYAIGKTDKSFTIPDSVTSIEVNALLGCSNLTSINIPDSVTSIGKRAFAWCSSLTSVVFGATSQLISIGYEAFSYCSSLESITIPDSVIFIRDATFSYCKSLTSITIPDSVKGIGAMAFYGCSSLTSITIPDSVKSIGTNAFYGCSSLTTVYFTGTEDEWNAIEGITSSITLLSLSKATIVFNYVLEE